MKHTATRLAAILPIFVCFATPKAPADSILQPEPLHAFSSGIADFYNGVVPGPGGFYGVSSVGGTYGRGAFFKIPNSGPIEILASFGKPDSSARGIRPVGTLAYDGTGFFYGVTHEGGLHRDGTIFRADTSGHIETLIDFTDSSESIQSAPGDQPHDGLTRGSDGNFYGVTSGGGIDDHGVVFRVSQNGRYQVLVAFTGLKGASPGAHPNCRLVELPAVNGGGFIGTTAYGGRSDRGTVFRISPTGTYTLLGEFTNSTGALPGGNPVGNLVLGLDGTVYGFTYSYDTSTPRLWKVAPNGVATPFVTLTQDTDGKSLNLYRPGFTLSSSGDIIGLANVIEASNFEPGLFRVTPAGQIFPLESIGSLVTSGAQNYNFDSNRLESDGAGGLTGIYGNFLFQRPGSGSVTTLATSDPDLGTGEGRSPFGNLVIAPDGTLFGLCGRGGANDFGTIFQRSSGGAFSPVFSLNNRDDYSPYHEASPTSLPFTTCLALSGNDVLFPDKYGGSEGAGSILRITAGGSVTTAASFTFSEPNDFTFPNAGLAAGLGAFYGRASRYNSTTSTTDEIIYRLTAANSLEFVAQVPKFSSNQGDFESVGALTFDGTGAFLGTQIFGGAKDEGLIYKVTPAGQVTKLTEFRAKTLDAQGPLPPLLLEPSGSFLVAMYENFDGESGALIRLSATGVPQQRLLRFGNDVGIDVPGETPEAPLARDATGRVFGVTASGGAQEAGVIYRLNVNGTYDILHEFSYGTTAADVGNTPSVGLTLGADGYIYGGTFAGGLGGGGTLFRFPINPSGSATTSAAEDVTSNSVTLKGVITSNGYGGTYWFTIEEVGGSTVETDHVFLPGFSGSQNLAIAVDALKGHRDYKVTLHSTLGAGADTVSYTGSEQLFHTPNGSPRPADDTIIVTQTTGGTVGEVLANDLPDPDDDIITIDPAGFTQPTYGTVTVGANNTVIYTPSLDFFDPNIGKGRDSFTYTVKDDQTPALSKTAKVDVLSTVSISGDYSGLLLDEEPAAAALPAGAEAITANQIAAGFASIALNKARKFTARFQIGTRTVAVKGTMAEGRGTRVTQTRAGFEGELRPTPGGVEGRITLNGRTLVLRMGQAFEAALGQVRETSDYTMRFDPQTVKDPLNSNGVPAGSGYAIVLERKKSRAKLVGVLPDGTAFSNGTVVGADKQMDFFTTIYKGKIGSIGGQLVLDNSGNIDGAAGTPVQWKKAASSKEKRFSDGFGTKLTAYGGKYTVPASTNPPFPAAAGDVLNIKFDRGGLFAPAFTTVGFNIKKPVLNPNGVSDPDAKAKVKFNQRTGLVTGTFIPVKKPVAWKALIIDRDKTARGFFLGTGDTGSVEVTIAP